VNITGWRFLVFAVAGAAAIVLLASIGVPSSEKVEVDRHTGEQRRVVRTIADVFHAVRETGDAQLALEKLESRLPGFPDDPVLIRLRAVLLAEFSGRADPLPEHHPSATILKAEQARAAEASDELRRRIREKIPKQSLLALLQTLEIDDAQAEAVEGYFAPLVHLRPDRPVNDMGADEKAAHADRFGSYLVLAQAFHVRNRPRARMRWLLRAYATNRAAFAPLYSAYIEQGRTAEAFHMLGAALEESPEDLELWRHRATLAGWQSIPNAEVEAQEFILEKTGAENTRRRLVELYTFVGRPEAAVPHVLILIKGSTDPKELERPVRLALAGGKVDLALKLLTDLAEQSKDPAIWREKIIAFARQDLRQDRVIKELKLLMERYPERASGYGERLEGLYRRRNMIKELAALLHGRLDREPNNLALENEVIALYSALGRIETVKDVIRRRINRNQDPRRFFEDLKAYRAIGIEGLVERARAMVTSPAMLPEEVPFVLETVAALEGDEWKAVAMMVARRFITEPAARDYLVRSVDQHENDAEREHAARKLFRQYPKNKDLLKVWIERAAWAGNIGSEIEGRERWLAYEPDDIENRRSLAELYGAVNRPEDAVVQWAWLSQKEGLRSPATLRLVDALFAAGRTDEAVTLLEKRAHLPGATLEEQLAVAEQLFASERLDRSLRFYMAVLDFEANHPLALLRAGQIRSWTNDPRGAIPFLQRRLGQTEERAGEVRFFLGEAHWAIQDAATAKAYHLRALDEISQETASQEIMRAKMLARLGQIEEAQPLFEAILAENPKNIHLLLDYVDAMLSVRRIRKARDLVDEAKRLEPRRARVIRADGKVALLEKRYEAAAEIMTEAMKRHGPEAGTESELGRALELSGRPRTAHEAYRRSLALQPANRDVEQALLRTWDKIAKIGHANLEFRQTGQDWLLKTWAAGSTLLPDNKTRLGVAFGLGSFSGRTNTSTVNLEQSVGLLSFAANHQLHRLYTIGGGIDVFPGAPGNAPIGLWLDAVLPHFEPYRVFGARIHVNRLWDDPAAAVSLGGRSTGVTLHAASDIGTRFWGLGRFKYESLSLTVPDVTDGRIDAFFAFGYRILEGETRVGERLAIDRSTLPGLIGPDLGGDPALTRGPLLSAWVSYQLIRLLDDKQLSTILPLGEAFDYLSLGARSDFHIANGWGAKVEGYLGYEFQQSEPFFGLEAGVTYRPSENLEFTLLAAYGRALGRADSENSFDVRFHLSYRW